MPKTRDYYEALGVSRGATKKEIQAAFRKLARESHPDAKPGDKEAEKRFKEISQAHTVLADAEKRKLYDAFGNDWQAARAAGAQPGQAASRGGSGDGSRVDYREVDATSLQRARASLRRRALDRDDEALAKALTPTPFAVRAAVLAARDHPYVNASIDLEHEEITLHRHYHVGIAAAGPDGLTVPVVHDADQRSLAELAHEIVALSKAARERKLRRDQLAGPTLTVNNFGSLGTWMGTPIVRPPEVVNVGVGAIRDRVVAVDGAPVVRPTLMLCVAADHRILDGDGLAAFVDQVARLLEDPVLLFEDLR